MRKSAKGIGLANVGGGRVGLIRGEVAARHPAVEWIGVAEKNPERGKFIAEKIGADFLTTDYRELLKRPEVTASIIATDEHLHVDPIMASIERQIPMLIEKPLATDLGESARVLKAIQDARLDVVVGYTQRFRRKWLAGKGKTERTGLSHEPRQVPAAATIRYEAQRGKALDEFGRFPGNDQIAGQCDIGAGPRGDSVDPGNDRLRQCGEGTDKRIPAFLDGFAEVDRLARGHRAVVEVLPSAKSAPRASQDDDPRIA